MNELCPRCQKESPTKWVVVEYEENRVPRWRKVTLCCNERIGGVHSGYSSPDGKTSVSPQFGLGSSLPFNPF